MADAVVKPHDDGIPPLASLRQAHMFATNAGNDIYYSEMRAGFFVAFFFGISKLATPFLPTRSLGQHQPHPARRLVSPTNIMAATSIIMDAPDDCKSWMTTMLCCRWMPSLYPKGWNLVTPRRFNSWKRRSSVSTTSIQPIEHW